MSMIKRDGWNKDNRAIEHLMDVLSEAQDMRYQIQNCTVASTFGSVEELTRAVKELADSMQEASDAMEREARDEDLYKSLKTLADSEDDEDEDDYDE